MVSKRFLRHLKMHIERSLDIPLEPLGCCVIISNITHHLYNAKKMLDTVEGLYLE